MTHRRDRSPRLPSSAPASAGVLRRCGGAGRWIAVLAACGALAASVAPAAGSSLPLLSTEVHGYQIKPKTIDFTGDGTGFLGGAGYRVVGKRPVNLGRINWTTYNSKIARGSGLVWLDDCIPDCADGTFHHFPMTVRADEVRPIRNHRFFFRLSIVWHQGRAKHWDVRKLEPQIYGSWSPVSYG